MEVSCDASCLHAATVAAPSLGVRSRVLAPAAPGLSRVPRLVAASARTLSAASSPTSSAVEELERLESRVPWWQSALLRLGGTFTSDQWQAAAGGDMYVRILEAAARPELIGDETGRSALPDRFYTRLQLQGLLCWVAHVRLRQEPKEEFGILYCEMMEKVWEQAMLDLSRGSFQMGYIEISKHIKAAQLRGMLLPSVGRGAGVRRLASRWRRYSCEICTSMTRVTLSSMRRRAA